MNTLITPDYRSLLEQAHAEDSSWGSTGEAHANWALHLFDAYECADALDYGAGKGRLAAAFNGAMRSYDPITFPDPPTPADLVTAIDVLEHIEPACLDAVLDEITQLARKVAYFVITTTPANKRLPDGRNAHLIIEDERYWLPRLADRMIIRAMTKKQKGLLVTCERRV